MQSNYEEVQIMLEPATVKAICTALELFEMETAMAFPIPNR